MLNKSHFTVHLNDKNRGKLIYHLIVWIHQNENSVNNLNFTKLNHTWRDNFFLSSFFFTFFFGLSKSYLVCLRVSCFYHLSRIQFFTKQLIRQLFFHDTFKRTWEKLVTVITLTQHFGSFWINTLSLDIGLNDDSVL